MHVLTEMILHAVSSNDLNYCFLQQLCLLQQSYSRFLIKFQTVVILSVTGLKRTAGVTKQRNCPIIHNSALVLVAKETGSTAGTPQNTFL